MRKYILLLCIISSTLYAEEFSKEMEECIRQGTREWNATRPQGIGPIDESACVGNLNQMRVIGRRVCTNIIQKCQERATP